MLIVIMLLLFFDMIPCWVSIWQPCDIICFHIRSGLMQTDLVKNSPISSCRTVDSSEKNINFVTSGLW